MRTTLWLLVLVGCGNEGGGSPAPADSQHCPMEKPEDRTSCAASLVGGDACTYLIETCACGPSDIEWTCFCTDGAWSCSRGYDCYPCPDAAM